MEDRSTVIQRELQWHEKDADRRIPLDRLVYDAPAFDSVVEPALAHLQARRGERVLDMGCGEGKETLELALRGLTVISMDLSRQQLSRARQRVQEAGCAQNVHFVQANAEALPFAANRFRIVYGKAIVHHLDGARLFQQLDRIMSDEGRATFAEPMAVHPLAWLFRRFTPALRTADERPMTVADMERFAQRFADYQLSVFFLLAPLAYVLRLLPAGEGAFRRTHAFLQRVDRFLFRRVPVLRRLAWYSLVLLNKRS